MKRLIIGVLLAVILTLGTVVSVFAFTGQDVPGAKTAACGPAGDAVDVTLQPVHEGLVDPYSGVVYGLGDACDAK